jgi:hypothetical protein
MHCFFFFSGNQFAGSEKQFDGAVPARPVHSDETESVI